MGINVNKYIGYSIDVLDEYSQLDDNIRDNWNSGYSEELKFKGYYSRQGSLKGYITLLYDGMSGDYCKLMYVEDYTVDCSDDDSDMIDTINAKISNTVVPDDIQKILKDVYRYITRKELSKDIKLEYLIHYT